MSTDKDHALVATETDDATVKIIDDQQPEGQPFEGPEKLLEIWFAPSAEDVKRGSNIGARPPSQAHGNTDGGWSGLRAVERATWEDMLDDVHCKVLSVVEGDELDAYLLSESSMFLWPHKLILKTCGTTTLLLGLPKILRIARETCGFPGAWRCFYSRKTFMFPDRQKGPHKSWQDEMKVLDGFFHNGSAYTVGRMNGDHWLLYVTAPGDEHTPHESLSHPIPRPSSSTLLPPIPASETDGSPALTPAESAASSTFIRPNDPSNALAAPIDALNVKPTSTYGRAASQVQISPKAAAKSPDQTLEILMTDLDQTAVSVFYYPEGAHATGATTNGSSSYTTFPSSPSSSGHALGSAVTSRIGLDTLIPSSTVDAFLFEPCGYSANIVAGEKYATVHVTPEVVCSYASFESNVELSFGGKGRAPGEVDLGQLVQKVIDIFKPGSVCITLFVEEDEHEDDDKEEESQERLAKAASLGDASLRALVGKGRVPPGYDWRDRILYAFEGYKLAYVTYEKDKAKNDKR